jgi:hypothetical protein
LFRCESAVLRTHRVLVVMDQCTRRIVGFGVHRGDVDGLGLCGMFNRATRGQSSPTYVSSDHDPLYRFHQWQANLRILDVKEIKTVRSPGLSGAPVPTVLRRFCHPLHPPGTRVRGCARPRDVDLAAGSDRCRRWIRRSEPSMPDVRRDVRHDPLDVSPPQPEGMKLHSFNTPPPLRTRMLD